MISRRLRAAMLLQVLLLLLPTSYLVADGRLTFTALLLALVAYFVINTCAIVMGYATLRGYARAFGPPKQLARVHSWQCAVNEMLALFVTFVLLQPFERWWMGKDTLKKVPVGQTVVLLVHGYLCNRGLWWQMRRRLRSRNIAAATINLEPPLADLDHLVAKLDQRIDSLLQETGAAKLVLIAHSMGSLVCRAYLQTNGATRVAALLMLGAPTHGTDVARLSCGTNARQMQPQSRWLRNLNSQTLPPIPICNIWSRDDEILLPPETARLEGASEIVLEDMGHMVMAFSPRVLQCLEAQLARI